MCAGTPSATPLRGDVAVSPDRAQSVTACAPPDRVHARKGIVQEATPLDYLAPAQPAALVRHAEQPKPGPLLRFRDERDELVGHLNLAREHGSSLDGAAAELPEVEPRLVAGSS